jgi:hypothetical protein
VKLELIVCPCDFDSFLEVTLAWFKGDKRHIVETGLIESIVANMCKKVICLKSEGVGGFSPNPLDKLIARSEA